MKIAIVCPGPSAADFTEERRVDYDVVIGVNRAVGLIECDYWVMLDEAAFAHSKPIGTPKMVTRGGIYRALCRAYPQAREHEFVSSKFYEGPPRSRWGAFSSTTALMFAVKFGGTEIDCYGADFEGNADWDGKIGCGREPERWEREAKLWGGLCRWLESRGVKVSRMFAAEIGEIIHADERVRQFQGTGEMGQAAGNGQQATEGSEL